MIIAIASGKGGTGKTTFAVNLAHALGTRESARSEAERKRICLLDCDVEEPNDHLFVGPRFSSETLVEVLKPVWDASRCTGCGICADVCNYNAIAVVKGKVLIFNDLCHSCGACSVMCPEGALSEKKARIGLVQTDLEHTPFSFAHGLLDVGEALAPNVVRAVKSHISDDTVTIIDAAPGTACPVVAAVEGADVALLVTEPTPFGLNDLKLAIGLTLKLGVPTGIVINRSDGTDGIIADYAAEIGLPIAGRIPFSRAYAEAYSEGNLLVEQFPELKENLLAIYDTLATALPPLPAEDVVEISTNPAPSVTPVSGSTHREITVISGKGGTGKTTLVASLAQLADSKVLADNDVDAADLHLLLAPELREKHAFVGGIKATIDPSLCIGCGICAAACHFAAIHPLTITAAGQTREVFRIDPLACEGCGLCPRICPEHAISSEDNVTGYWYVSDTAFGPMAHARLGIAEENSGRLVTQVRTSAGDLAAAHGKERILGDGPPGTGCPVIASVSGTDLVLIVTEPTVSGVHDMERVLQLAAHFRVPVAVIINKADLNQSQSQRIEEIARTHGAAVIGHIPFDRVVNDALMAGKTVIEYGRSKPERAIRGIWKAVKGILADMG